MLPPPIHEEVIVQDVPPLGCKNFGKLPSSSFDGKPAVAHQHPTSLAGTPSPSFLRLPTGLAATRYQETIAKTVTS